MEPGGKRVRGEGERRVQRGGCEGGGGSYRMGAASHQCRERGENPYVHRVEDLQNRGRHCPVPPTAGEIASAELEV